MTRLAGCQLNAYRLPSLALIALLAAAVACSAAAGATPVPVQATVTPAAAAATPSVAAATDQAASADVIRLAGDLTIRDITRPATWDVTATVTDGRELAGTATTVFTFADFELNQPRVPLVLSIEDQIQLEIDFHMLRAS